MHLLSEKMKRHKNTAETINLDLIKKVGGGIKLRLFEPYTTYLVPTIINSFFQIQWKITFYK